MSKLMRALAFETRGVVLVEFLIAFAPILLLFLGGLQLALLSSAQLVVQHAAVVGVRSAIVVLEDAPKFYAGSPEGELAKSSRMAAIREAVHARLTAIAPAARAAAYLPIAAATTFPIAPGASELHSQAVPAEGSVTLRVTYLFPCLVPLVAGLVCDRLAWNARRHALSSGRASSDRREQALLELTCAPHASEQTALAGSTAMAVIQAEATLPAQAAHYAYRDASDARDTGEAAP